MQGKTHLYKELSKIARLDKVFGYQTSAYRKSLNLPKRHDVDALCVAMLTTGEVIDQIASQARNENFYRKPKASVYS
ncbi:hypothetical protein H8E77_41085 [bacterium]|nr:hypothetical protein [bacterium]